MNYKERYLNLLGSKIFPDILESSLLQPLIFNKLMIAHISTILSQCNGIKEGHCYLNYVTSTSLNFKKDVIGPLINFSIYTNTYALIEHTNRSTRSSSKITNLNDFTSSDFHNPITLKNFIKKQELKMKHLPGYTYDMLKNEKTDIKYIKPGKNERLDYFYETIIASNKIVENFLSHYFLQNELNKEVIKTSKKMKI